MRYTLYVSINGRQDNAEIVNSKKAKKPEVLVKNSDSYSDSVIPMQCVTVTKSD